MTKRRASRGGAQGEARRKRRRRPVPKWLASAQLDQVARSRALLVLSVLSGEKPVSDAIEEAGISRGTYYQMEARALEAMLGALNPMAPTKAHSSAELAAAAARIAQLQARVARLEVEKRRTERLLLLTRRTIRGPVTTGRRGRLPKSALLVSIPSGRLRSGVSEKKVTLTLGSIQTKAGESAP